MKMRKNGVTQFVKKHNITKLEPIPTKPVLLCLITEENILKQYIVDNIAKASRSLTLSQKRMF